MDLQIELYSTPTVEGKKILSSKGFVCANIVLGTGVFYDEYLDPTNERAMNEELYRVLLKLDNPSSKRIEPYHVELFEALEREVLNKGCNAIIDLHVEHSYVHYGDHYYLLISAQGTAVVLEGIVIIPENKNIKSNALEQQIFRKLILSKLKEWHNKHEESIEHNCKLKLTADEWEFICKYPDLSFAEHLHVAYIEDIFDDKTYYINVRHSRHVYTGYFDYFEKLPYKNQIELAYTYCDWRSSDLIVKCDLFNAKHVLEWAQKGEFEFATLCLKAQKKEYSAQDLEDMQNLYDFFANLPEKVGRIEERNDERRHQIVREYICNYCNRSYISSNRYEEISYCPHCKKGKKGLTQEQEERVKDFGIKIEALKELLARNK